MTLKKVIIIFKKNYHLRATTLFFHIINKILIKEIKKQFTFKFCNQCFSSKKENQLLSQLSLTTTLHARWSHMQHYTRLSPSLLVVSHAYDVQSLPCSRASPLPQELVAAGIHSFSRSLLYLLPLSIAVS